MVPILTASHLEVVKIIKIDNFLHLVICVPNLRGGKHKNLSEREKEQATLNSG